MIQFFEDYFERSKQYTHIGVNQRSELQDFLLNNADDATKICSNCFDNCLDTCLSCFSCKRKMHSICLNESYSLEYMDGFICFNCVNYFKSTK